jgi:hypothetical protein
MSNAAYPPKAIAEYFDAIGSHYLLTQTFTPTDGWSPVYGSPWTRRATQAMCCELAAQGVTAVQVIGTCVSGRAARADFQMSELIDEFDRLAHAHPCTTC